MTKKITTIILSIIIILNLSPFNALAEIDSNDFYAQYSGTTQASYGYNPDCTFTITKIIDDRFTGYFSATGLGRYNINQDVKGIVYSGASSFTCIFSLSNYYNTSFVITVYPNEGYCRCITSGNWHFEDFEMTGTIFSYSQNVNPITSDNFSEDDFKTSMALSVGIYSQKTNFINDEFRRTLNKNGFNENNVTLYKFGNFGDSNKNDVAFAIANKYSDSNDDNNIVDMFVIIRGTYYDEWSGNFEITGESYSNIDYHVNFKTAEESIKSQISKEYNKLSRLGYIINLIITGHSRGAAVANLYAKEATDCQVTANSLIPQFNKVTAYTFATPNVEKYYNGMESYNNIFNFCFSTDFVPTIPLTNPTQGWNYWKYGETYYCDFTDLRNENYAQLGISTEIINKDVVESIHKEFARWTSVERYYNRISNPNNDYMPDLTLYKYLHDGPTRLLSNKRSWQIVGGINTVTEYGSYDDFRKLTNTLVCNIHTLKKSHDYKTYNTIISNFSNKYFARVSYSNYISNTGTVYRIATQSKNTTIIFNENDIAKLETIYNNNSDVCDWDLSDPTTCNGIIWNDNGNVESIDFSYMNLEGTLDLSNFSSLKSLNLSGNNLTSVNLDNCSSLEEIDCSFNKLTTLDLSDCTNLTSVTCCYNYLDTHEGSTLYNKLDDLMFSDCYVNYYPQSVPDNATFDTTELNALKTFANTNNNNTALNWLDDSGNIDTEKLQNNILFEYDGSKHHVVAIDISDLDISGALDLTSLSLLQEIYCENTKITTLNTKGCTKLETLKCDGCELTSITLPSNANAKTSSLYDVSCEYNYLDTSIFTQDIIKYVEFKAGGEIQYKNQKGDSSALQAALYFANKLDEKDYSEETFTPFKELIDECNAYNYDNLYLTQEDIDEITTNILVSMYELKAYFKVNISSSNGSFTVNDEKSNSSYKQSLLYGTTVTLNAVPNEGYIFVGWYDTVNNIYMSKNPEYTFKVSTNTDLKAVFIAEGSATLTFVNYSNWVAGTFTKSTAEWAEVTSINDLLPEVPFRFGYSNGRWVYDEQEVLSKLQAGEDVVIGAEYDEDDASFPTPPVAKDKPVLELYYKYNEENTLGTFMMAAGFPENIKIESVGIAFYYKKADLFDPRDNFTLLLNNKMMIGRFNTEQLEDIYIINMHNMTSTYNWAARGFVTYYDSNGNLATEYSNQINIIDRQNTDEIK